MGHHVPELDDESRERFQQALGEAYRLERELGRGGMATVYLAHDQKHDRKVALKVLHADLGAAMGPERFRREVHLAAGLQHPHIVPLLVAGEASGLLYYTMPFVEGETLRARIAREGALPTADVVRLVREVADALAYAHERGIVHRDVKPENVLLSRGHAMVTDFGIAKALAAATQDGASSVPTQGALTATGLALGTPAYMAPEQGLGDSATDHRADLYALGVLTYELLVGETPFGGRTPQQLVAAHISQQPPPLAERCPDVPPALAMLVSRLLAKNPDDRPQSAEAVTRCLDELSTGTALSHSSAGRARMLPAWFGAHRAILVGSLGALAVVAVVTAVVWRSRSPGRQLAALEASATRKLLAVLPFKHVGAPAEAYFAEGMTEELTTKLASLSGLGVISRTSTDQYRGTTKPLTQIAKELGVDYVLEGSVRWDHTPSGAGRVRVTPQLIRVSDDTHLWADTYDADVARVFEVQANIADRVAAALDVAIQGRERKQLARVPTTNFKAYDLFLRGLQREDDHTPRGTLDALALYDSAVALDPTFARAHAFRYYLHERFYRFGWDRTASRRAMSRAALEAALRVGPDDPDALTAAAEDAMVGRGDLVEASQLIARLLRDHPSSSGAWLENFVLQFRRGDWQGGLASIRRAVELDPNVAQFAKMAAEAHAYARRFADAQRYYQRAVALNPDDPAALADWATMQARHLADTNQARHTLQSAAQRFGVVRTIAAYPNEMLFTLLSRVQQDSLATASFDRTTAVDSGALSRAGYYAWKARFFHWRGDSARARSYADSTRGVAEVVRRGESGDVQIASAAAQWLAYSLAIRGRKAEAIAEAQRSVSAAQQAADTNAVIGARTFLARVYATVGERERAVGELRYLLTVPSPISRTSLRVDPVWASLRNQPGFVELTKG